MRIRALLVTVACVAIPVSAADAAPGPRLTLLDRSPVVLGGAGFDPREEVRVTVRAPSLVVQQVVLADRNGRFRTSIPRLSLTGALRCAIGVTIVARPRTGESLLWRPPRLRDCASPPLQPA